MNELFQAETMERPALKPNTVFHVGVSGGKDSVAALLWMVHESGIDKSKIVATFCDIKNDHPWTIEHVERINKTVHPVETIHPELGFFDLAFKKKRFPSTKARFCTEHLKIYPTRDYITKLIYGGASVIAVSGTRADESEDRKNKPEWDYNGFLLCLQWRPLIRWTLEDVLAIHRRYGVPMNPLYALGAKRVGCWPCIMSRKSEIRMIALKCPERIDEIREAEQKFERENGRYSSFFPRTAVPPRFRTKPFIQNGVQVMEGGEPMMIATIDDVVRWSMTGNGAKGSYEDEAVDEPISCKSGFCE